MSLTTVTKELTEKAEKGDIGLEEFIGVIQQSLPRAWALIQGVVSGKKNSPEKGSVFSPETLENESRGELLRVFASDAMRNAVQEYFGVKLAFQNCHTIGAFLPEEKKEYENFTSISAQILNQHPNRRDC